MDNQEYEWVKGTRHILLEQCSTLSEEELSKSFDVGFQSIKQTLVHIAGCYHAWLGSYVLNLTSTPLNKEKDIEDVSFDDIVDYFKRADQYVEAVLNLSEDEFYFIHDKKLSWRPDSPMVHKSAKQLLFHSISHEFHHKGQIVTFIRLLGYTPKNTDVLGIDTI
ncbi:DinB family protein [Mammaliicoccus sp. Dog046]|uniref:DinB family protein n=1 Tax=Mammaliicoccus sp. Dog046 TaxID=3034233 RepID=UPI002B263475|nr:DinB family protein [Mammaliicoccus sp. Dog046]WQK84952.1 DinB family protein [Mammaliicoccus sp. Dog046]